MLFSYNKNVIIKIIILKKCRQCKADIFVGRETDKNVGRETDIHPISPKTPALQYQPIDRKKRKRKRVEDYGRDRAA